MWWVVGVIGYLAVSLGCLAVTHAHNIANDVEYGIMGMDEVVISSLIWPIILPLKVCIFYSERLGHRMKQKRLLKLAQEQEIQQLLKEEGL